MKRVSKKSIVKDSGLTFSQEVELEYGSGVIHPLAPELDRKIESYNPLTGKINYFKNN